MDFHTIKKQVDQVANIVKMIEELDPNATVLPNIFRSLQLDPFSCGLQSVFVILNYYRKKTTPGKLKKELQTDWSGTALPDIERVFKKYGLKVRIIRRAKMKHLISAIDAECPVLISTLNGGHWAVVYGYSQSHIYLCDPSLITNLWCRIPKEEFQEQWDNWGMVVDSKALD